MNINHAEIFYVLTTSYNSYADLLTTAFKRYALECTMNSFSVFFLIPVTKYLLYEKES